MRAKPIQRVGRLARTRLGTWRWTALLTLISGFIMPGIGQPLQLASVLDPAQVPSVGGGDSWTPIISPDGRYVLFSSTANNLVLTSKNTAIPARFPSPLNVFQRDRTNGTTTLVSVNLTGKGGGNGDSLPADLSTNGRYAVFTSGANNLVPGDTNNATDIFWRDLVTGTTVLVSVSTNGEVGNGVSRSPAMTPDGRYVAFVSAASNLMPGDTNGLADIFVRDLEGGTTVLVSVGASTGAGGAGSFSDVASESPDITPDGRYVVFYSLASNLLAGATNYGDIYVRDLVAGTTYWASTNARAALQAARGTASAVCYNHVISADGQFVAYEASPTPGSAAVSPGIILRYNLGTGLTGIVSTNASVPAGNPQDVRSLDMTPDGRFIAFVANTNGLSGLTTCVYVWDAQAGTAGLASGNLGHAVPANSTCDWPVIDPSGRYVAFLSTATNMVTNSVVGDYHLYQRDLQSGTTTLIDADTNGIGSPLTPTATPRMSADGRFVVFECGDGNLAPNDRNHDSDVFLRDVTAGTTELISARDATLASLSPNGASLLSPCSVSADGRYIAFASEADNLGANDTNGCRDVFVRDPATGTNLLVSVGTNGFSGNGPSTDPAISADGRYVAFASTAANLVAGDSNKAQDVFVRDLQDGTTSLVSVNSTGTGPGNQASYSPMISANGRYVVFRSKATNLAPGSFSGNENLLVRDLQTGTNYALTTAGMLGAAMTPDGRFVAFVDASGKLYVWNSQLAARVYTNSMSALGRVALSPDGKWLAYAASGGCYVADTAANTNAMIGPALSDLQPGLRFSADGRWLAYTRASGGTNQVYLYGLQSGANLLASHRWDSMAEASGASDWPDISADGRFVAYRNAATDLVAGVTNGVPEIYLYDRQTGTNLLLSAGLFGNSAPHGRSLCPAFSGDGRTLVFQSWASDLATQDFNHTSDVFAYAFLYASITQDIALGQGCWLSWPFAPGSNYRVQFRDSLGNGNWQDLNGTVTNTGNRAYLKDAAPGAPQRFYRILAF